MQELREIVDILDNAEQEKIKDSTPALIRFYFPDHDLNLEEENKYVRKIQQFIDQGINQYNVQAIRAVRYFDERQRKFIPSFLLSADQLNYLRHLLSEEFPQPLDTSRCSLAELFPNAEEKPSVEKLDFAIKHGNLEIIKTLLDHIDQQQDLTNSCKLAIERGQLPILTLLLENHPIVGRELVAHALKTNRFDCLRFLLKHYPFRISKEMIAGMQNTIFRLLNKKSPEMIDLLKEATSHDAWHEIWGLLDQKRQDAFVEEQCRHLMPEAKEADLDLADNNILTEVQECLNSSDRPIFQAIARALAQPKLSAQKLNACLELALYFYDTDPRKLPQREDPYHLALKEQPLIKNFRNEPLSQLPLLLLKSNHFLKQMPLARYKDLINSINETGKLSPQDAEELQQLIPQIIELEKDVREEVRRLELALNAGASAHRKPLFFSSIPPRPQLRIKLAEDFKLGQEFLLYDPVTKKYTPDDSLRKLSLTLEERKQAFEKIRARGKLTKEMKHAAGDYRRAWVASEICRFLDEGEPIPETLIYDSAEINPEEKQEEHEHEESDILFLRCNMFSVPHALAETHPELKNVWMINAANEFSIGGGVFRGSHAQEEMLMRINMGLALSFIKKTVDAVLTRGGELYARGGEPGHWPRFKDTQAMVTKNLRLTNEAIIPAGYDWAFTYYEKSQFNHSIHVMSNASLSFKNEDMSKKTEKNQKTIKNRIKAHIKAAVSGGAEVLILTAFGCGAFNNDPRIIGRLYAEVIVEENIDRKIKKIIFAVLRNEAFITAFSKHYQELRQPKPYARDSEVYSRTSALVENLHQELLESLTPDKRAETLDYLVKQSLSARGVENPEAAPTMAP